MRGSESADLVGKAAADGGYCRLVQRRLSGLVSPTLARWFSPNAVTTIDLVVGIAAAICILADQLLAGALLIQVFGVLSCSDGEVARIRAATSAIGDFYDTMTDRIVEMTLIVTVAAGLYRSIGVNALWAGLLTLSGVLLLVVSSEKFRSAFRTQYPKAHWEKLFVWISAGGDARQLVLTVLLGIWAVWGPAPALTVLWILAGAIALNLLWRARVIARRAKTLDLGGSS